MKTLLSVVETGSTEVIGALVGCTVEYDVARLVFDVAVEKREVGLAESVVRR